MQNFQIGLTIRRLRLLNSMTQEELAAKLHVSAQSVSKWETGVSNPDIAYVPEIAEAFQVPIQELFCDISSRSERNENAPRTHQDIIMHHDLHSALSQSEIDFLYTQQDKRTAKGNKVLIVDDAPFMVQCIRSILEESKFNIIGEAENGYLAVEAANTILPDIIIMDLVMPHMDGFDAARLILNQHPHVCLIACTAMAYPEIVSKTVEIGFSGFICKPFLPEFFKSYISKYNS